MPLSLVEAELVKVTRGRWLATTGEGERIRTDAGLSIAEVAAAIGVNPLTLRRWEAGETTPGTAAAIRWYEVIRDIAEHTSDEAQ